MYEIRSSHQLAPSTAVLGAIKRARLTALKKCNGNFRSEHDEDGSKKWYQAVRSEVEDSIYIWHLRGV